LDRLHLKKQTLKPGFHLIGSRVETRRLSSYGSSWIQRVQPRLASLAVAVQVEFASKLLKPGYLISGSRV
jgi:hypothetical protein